MRTDNETIDKRGEQAMQVANEVGRLQIPDLMNKFGWSRPVVMTVLCHLVKRGQIVQTQKEGRNLVFSLPLLTPAAPPLSPATVPTVPATVAAHVLPPVLNKDILSRIHLGAEFKVTGLFAENGNVKVNVKTNDGKSLQLVAAVG